MKTLREAAAMALKSLEDAIKVWTEEMEFRSCVDASDEWLESYAVLREALSEPEQEPVAWMVYTQDGTSVFVTDNPKDFTDTHRALPLYTSPPQRKPLTNGEIYTAYITATNQTLRPQDERLAFAFARAIERAHGIGEKE